MEPRNFESGPDERIFDEPIEPVAEEAAWHPGKKPVADEELSDEDATEKAYLEELRGVGVQDDSALEE